MNLKSLDFSHSQKMIDCFKDVFKLSEFRPSQLEAINAALLGNDVFVIMPTGGGKSLCYQLPALVSAGVSIVVSPLLSLIQDQETKLNYIKSGCAASLTSNTNSKTKNLIYANLRSAAPTFKVIFVTPERLNTCHQLKDLLVSLYNRMLLSFFVVDEVHCISQWGNDFRPAYSKLNLFRNQFPKVPCIALTATATLEV